MFYGKQPVFQNLRLQIATSNFETMHIYIHVAPFNESPQRKR